MAIPPPETPPSTNKGSLFIPLLANAVLMLVLYVLAYASSGSGNTTDIVSTYFFALVGLFLVNVLAAVIAALSNKSQTALGFLFSILGIFLIGLGNCAYLMYYPQTN